MLSTKNISVQKWGNSLAVRIPATFAHRAHIVFGSQLEMSVVDNYLTLTVINNQKLTLEQRLAQFDPEIHGGEVMPCENIGLEKWNES